MGQRRGLGRSLSWSVVWWLSLAGSSPAHAGTPGRFNDGLRWIGVAPSCVAPAGWTAERVFRGTKLPPALANLCLYTWRTSGEGAPPSSTAISVLFTASRASELTEDVPVVFPSADFSTQELALLDGLRGAFQAQVGDVSVLPGLASHPAVRVVVIDSAPDAPPGLIHPGPSRHGDTLAHLIEDLVCLPREGGVPRACAAEVTSELALPWLRRGVLGSTGGFLGSLADLARAVERAVATWQSDRRADPQTPAHLVLNLSLGWEHTAGIADCSLEPSLPVGPAARAVRGILQYAVSQGALVVAAAGNDSGGKVPRRGLVCPGLFQSIPQDLDPSQSLVVAVSGVDYQDRALETARPDGLTGIVGLGLGGVAWDPADPAPPALTGSSVSTAVASAVSALVWAARPTWTPGEVTRAVYEGGAPLATPANACPLSIGPCHSRRASVCGALFAANLAPSCSLAPAGNTSSPPLPGAVDDLTATYANVVPSLSAVVDPLVLATLPRYLASTVQVQPSIFPMPISETCPTCVVRAGQSVGPNVFLIPSRSQVLIAPQLAVRLADGSQRGVTLMPQGSQLPPAQQQLAVQTRYVFPLPPSWHVVSAFLTGFELGGSSLAEEILVEP